jgi:hypothetical protein
MTKADESPEEIETPPVPAEPNPAADAFYGRAESRMASVVVFIAVVGAVGVLVFVGWQAALGFVAGSVLVGFNIRSLHRSVANAARTLEGKALAGVSARASTAMLAFGLVLRLALVTAAGYAIFRSSIQGFYGFVGGLFMPVCAVFAEALYEAWGALRRGL